MIRFRAWLAYCFVLVAVLQSQLVGADPVQELQTAGHLQVDSSLTPEGALVPGQKATLTLKVATDRWFAGGTRVSIPEVPGLVILQTEQFASNASENRNGNSWVIQRWTLDVYPQREGEFSIPPIRLRVAVNAGEAGNVEGELYSPPVQFSTSSPAGLSQAQHWVASPSFSVTQHFDRSLEGLQVGDAFEREILFEATDVLAMMLPAFTADEFPGLAAYPSPPVLENNSNRGQTSARRIQRISYVVEAQGEYLMPAREFFWWDTQNASLQLLSLPAVTLTVGRGSSAPLQAGREFKARSLLLPALGLLALAALAWLASKWLPLLPLGRVAAIFSRLWQQLGELRKPALPSRLNPDNSAGD